MSRTVLFAVALMLGAPAARADDPLPTVKDWVEQYEKLGGKVYLWPPEEDEGTIGIWKREGQKPLVGLKGLKPAAGIRRVALQGFELTDDDVAALAGWKELDRVDVIDAPKVTDKGVKALAALPKLRVLVLADTAVTSDGVNAFSGHKGLTHLTVSNTVVKNRVTALDLKDLPELKGLVLVGEGMTKLRLTKLPKLEWECVVFPGDLEEAEFSELGSMTQLNFRNTRLKKLALSGLPKLESLDLRKTQLDADAVAAVRKAFSGVKVQR
jgi:hypothetical protein